jgi:Putative salt-induced outer membrane protein
MQLLRFTLHAIFLLCVLQSVSAQSPKFSIDSKRASKSKISTNISVGGSYWSGNVDKSIFTGSLRLAAVDSIKEFSFDAKYTFGKNDGKLNQREFLTGLQYDYHPLSTFSPFLRMDLYSNEFKSINLRYSGYAGAKYRLFVNQKEGITTSDFSISGALTYVYEKFVPEVDKDNQHKVRLSIRPKIKQIISKNILLQSEIYFKPKINCWEDYIVYSMSSISVAVNDNISVKLIYEYDYESKPVTDNIRKTDSMFVINLGFKF